MTNRWKNRSRAWLVAWLAVAAAGAVPAVHGEDRAAVREQRRKRIESMSELDRERIKRNFKEFRELSKDERDRLRQLDRAVKGDPDLHKTMDEYATWLATLTPVQRNDLRKEADPGRREKLVRELIAEQQSQPQMPDPTRRTWGGGGLSATDLAAVLDVLEQAMRETGTINPLQIAELEKRQGLVQQIYLLELAFRRAPNDMRPLQPPNWLTADVVDAMASKITDEKKKHRLRRFEGFERTKALFGMIYGGIWTAWLADRPDEETLQKFFVELKSQEQDQIFSLPFHAQQWKLTQMYKDAHPERYPHMPMYPFGWAPPRVQRGRDGQPGDEGQPGRNPRRGSSERPPS